ncbi:CTP synthase isoform X3 [Helianthus annuus]|uniref:CTP synthase isoform X3 n=1 Tax=Helianthus annuus TaxID=4232 RepID=UPI001652B7CD|nr:CTP synthase isoform X3 [Helianthus annuus]
MKYVLITGGVVSGLGKGVTASSIGVVLKACGLRLTSIKIDPYLNTDAGTMSPFEHGEVFVLDDGGEVDLDLGNYERFLDVRLTRDNNITTGKIYQSVLEKERKGDYLGKTVQVVPHITDAIKDWIESVSAIPVDGKAGPADVCVIELGGTVGDIESMPFIEALRQLYFSKGPDNFCLIHVSLVPVLGVVGEQKTKPTQHSVRELRALGLTPHFLACRSAQPLLENTKQKLSQFCQVPVANILNIHDVPNIWHVPLVLRNQNAHEAILKQLALLGVATPPNLQEWTARAENFDNLTNSVKIAMVGKYVGLTDSYLSVVKSLLHACTSLSFKPSIEWIAASDLEDESAKLTPEAHTKAWETLRILGWKGANSTEFDEHAPNPVVIFMPEGSRTHMGSTMRLGSRRTLLQTSDCITAKLCHNPEYVDERHRHRYEVNPEVVGDLEKTGLRFVGKDETGQRMEILELQSHPFYVGVQFHPEYKSRPGKPSALFLGLILAATGKLEAYVKTHQNGSI